MITIDFNSRPCGRGDAAAADLAQLYDISIHAPAGGATGNTLVVESTNFISIHAPAGGATVYIQEQRLL